MQRGAEDLGARGGKELSDGGAGADLLFDLGGKGNEGAQPRGEIEGGEHGEGIAESEKRVAG